MGKNGKLWESFLWLLHQTAEKPPMAHTAR